MSVDGEALQSSCAIAGCERLRYSRGICEAHYRRWRRTGSLDEATPIGVRAPSLRCAVPDCTGTAVEREWCHGHYQRWLRTGAVQANIPLGRRRQPEECIVCGRPTQAKGLCATHYGRHKTTGDVRAEVPRARRNARGEGSITRYGYRAVTVRADDLRLTGGATRVLEHRLVMARALDRPLYEDENVHHINGDRLDNRLENLELWSTSQPRGQRVQDKLEWAVDVVRRYRPHLLE